MLQLQRASAGSGKTYTLAKKFIEYFISYRTETGTRRLRSLRMLRDSLPHILAITFTNKATNEMKLRIVEKLDALAHWTPDVPSSKVDYLDQFAEAFSASPEDIAAVADEALKILLNDYGDFKVSTIDSFFQTVLRTFAYEADLDDTYQIELDSSYVAQVGLDTTLDDMETSRPVDTGSGISPSDQGSAWILNLIEEKSSSGRGWNIFQKNAKEGNIYRLILDASRNLTKEDFKMIREDLDRYFSENPDFFSTYHRLRNIYERDARRLHSRMKKAAQALIDGFEHAGIDIDATAGQHLAGRARKFANIWDWNFKEAKPITIPSFSRKGSASRVFNPKVENPYLDTDTEDTLEALAIEMYDAYQAWSLEMRSPKMAKWRLYAATLPYIGILQSVRDNSREFLNGVNAVELAETNSILGRIISGDDAPFVYERLGSRLEHFLIDEFQDTSRLQWNNLRPLLAESEGRGNDNLIIGDAKQSIYRFRNADPSLITKSVPEEFRASVRKCGDSPAENTNWRSMRRIVEFNNLFFRFFSKTLSPEMESLYSNSVQPPRHRDESGYVEVRLFKKTSGEESPAHFDKIPLMIEDMLQRGYSQKDIAILVDRHEDGRRIIDSIMSFNRSVDSSRKIDFISADSLQVGDSSAVMTVISVLEAIEKGTRAQLREDEERRKKGVGEWSKLKANFSFFAMTHRDLSLSEQMQRFLDGEYDPDVISSMLARMQTTALPALIESISENFLSESSRDSQAPFLAALQDLVIDFCDSHPADIASFLQWWDMKGRFRSISSPEDADAVQIMTVHKSKGLEFRCVIVPNSKQTVAPGSFEKEWLWVTPDLSEAPDIPQIPWIPVWSNYSFDTTSHAPVKESYLKKYMTDKVNMAYVAYTRAIDELYIFAPYYASKDGEIAKKGCISEYLWQCGSESSDILPDLIARYTDIRQYLPETEDINVDRASLSWTLGHKPDREEVLRTSLSRRKGDSGIPVIPIERYPSSSALPQLQYHDPMVPDDSQPAETGATAHLPEESEEQIRMGEILHRVMERVAVPADLHKSLLRMKSRRFISFPEMLRLEKILSSAIKSVESRGWFSPGLELLCERAIMVGGYVHRPDRVILNPDGSAVIIDYKFGEHRADSKYSDQLRRYAEVLRTASIAQKSEAYIWYVSLGSVVKVDVS